MCLFNCLPFAPFLQAFIVQIIKNPLKSNSLLSSPHQVIMEPINSKLYHRYLKGQSLFSDVTALSAFAEKPLPPIVHQWDLPKTSKPMSAALEYISARLSEEGLSIQLIISDQAPFIIPIWQLSSRSQITLCRIVRKACEKFTLAPSWLTALASLSKKDLPNIFNTYTPDMYIVRRSILQREVVFVSEGLTLLTIDHVFTFKQLLRTLSKKDWVSGSRYRCLESSVSLLSRIQRIYNGTPVTATYIKRVYQEIPLQSATLNEVITEYNARYCTEPPSAKIQKVGGCETKNSTSAKELDVVQTWEAIPMGPTSVNNNNNYNKNNDGKDSSPVPITYPTVKRQPRPPPPPPTPSITCPIKSTRQTIIPPPSSYPPTRQLPPLPSRPVLRISVPSSRATSTSPTGSRKSDTSPTPLRNSKNTSPQSIIKPITFPTPPGYSRQSVPLIPSPVDDETESEVTRQLTEWEVNMLESPDTAVDSAGSSSGPRSALPEGLPAVGLCLRCHEAIVLGGAAVKVI